jgi:tyrosyl-tRNA synthetase
MGKTMAGAVWLNEDQLPAYDYWQFWRNTHDGDVGRFLRLFTDLPLDEIVRLEKLEGAEINHAKVVLATEATKLCRGAEAAVQAQTTAQETFAQGGAGGGLPTIRVTEGTIGIVTALTVLGFAGSNGEARRKIAEGAVRLNDIPIKDERYEIVLDQDAPVKLSLGKKRHGLLERG